ncbi:hypothetical protein QZH41_004409 [Actinostola sp. cb2023]|nr:hypothetical protein QZH41_004409 [Actinostola sp. cb2023]
MTDDETTCYKSFLEVLTILQKYDLVKDNKNKRGLLNMPKEKWKLWNDENMLAAIDVVKEGMPVRKAATTFNVPRSSLNDRIQGRVLHGSKSSPEKMLTSDEEKLAKYLIFASNQGYGKSKEIILFMATSIAKKRTKNIQGNCLSEKWWRGFLNRHPELSLRASQNFGLVRTLITRPLIKAFYKRLLDTMTQNQYGGNLTDKPHLIFNCDESGFEFNAINKIVAAARGATHVPRISKGQHEKSPYHAINTVQCHHFTSSSHLSYTIALQSPYHAIHTLQCNSFASSSRLPYTIASQSSYHAIHTCISHFYSTSPTIPVLASAITRTL